MAFLPLVRGDEIRLIVVDGVNCLVRYERKNLDHVARALFERFQLVPGKDHEPILLELIALLHVRALDFLSSAFRNVLLLDARAVGCKHVESDRSLTLGGGIQLYGNGNQTKRQGEGSN